jgi:hypothetical protein
MPFDPSLTQSIAQHSKKPSKAGSPKTKILTCCRLNPEKFMSEYHMRVPEFWDQLWDFLVEEGAIRLPLANRIYLSERKYNVFHEVVHRKLQSKTGLLAELQQVEPYRGNQYGLFQSSTQEGHEGFMVVILFSSRDELDLLLQGTKYFNHRIMTKDEKYIVVTPLSTFTT